MTDKEFFEYKEKVLACCPRGEEYFCDGTPNLSVPYEEKPESIGKCSFRVNGKCTRVED